MTIAAYLATVLIALHCLVALAWQLRNRMLQSCRRQELPPPLHRRNASTQTSATP
ncbi:MAG: hypothetical protein ACK5OB_16000 [Pirellula sp.]